MAFASMPVFYDPSDLSADRIRQIAPSAIRLASLEELCRHCNLLFLAVKPQVMPEVLRSIGPVITSKHLVISIAAGISIGQLQSSMPQGAIVRVMPNTPCLVGQGISAIAWTPKVTDDDRQLVRRIFESVGKIVEVPEQALDAVTGLSGSGPAYVFRFVEALIEAGIRNGLDPQVSSDLACATVSGAMALLAQTGRSPAELRQDVTSPGGTTLAGLEVLEVDGFAETIIDAVGAATRRSRELGAR